MCKDTIIIKRSGAPGPREVMVLSLIHSVNAFPRFARRHHLNSNWLENFGYLTMANIRQNANLKDIMRISDEFCVEWSVQISIWRTFFSPFLCPPNKRLSSDQMDLQKSKIAILQILIIVYLHLYLNGFANLHLLCFF